VLRRLLRRPTFAAQRVPPSQIFGLPILPLFAPAGPAAGDARPNPLDFLLHTSCLPPFTSFLCSPLYHLIEPYLPEFERTYDQRYAPRYGSWRPIIGQVARRFLRCGDLHFGRTNGHAFTGGEFLETRPADLRSFTGAIRTLSFRRIRKDCERNTERPREPTKWDLSPFPLPLFRSPPFPLPG